MSIASLSIDILARLADFERDMGKASRIAEKQAAQIERAFAGTRAAMASVGAALGASFSAAGLVQFFRVTVDGIDKLNDLFSCASSGTSAPLSCRARAPWRYSAASSPGSRWSTCTAARPMLRGTIPVTA